MTEQRIQSPHDREAEQAVLGTVIHDNYALDQLQAMLSPQDFFSPGHLHIYEAMLRLHREQTPIDEITLGGALKARGVSEASGGISYLTELTDRVQLTSNVLVYAEIVAEKARARRLLEACREAVKGIIRDGEIGSHGEGIREALAASAPSDVLASDDAHGLFTRWWEAFNAPSAHSPAKTHIRALDALLGTIDAERPCVIAARTGKGKSILCGNLWYRNAAAGLPTLLFSLELSAEAMAARTLSMLTHIPGQQVIYGDTENWSESHWNALAGAVEGNADLPLYCKAPRRAFTLDEIEACAREHVQNRGVGLVIVDHLARIHVPRSGDEYAEQTARIRGLAQMQTRLGVPVVVAAQINRAGDELPELRHLKGSGDIEEWIAQCVILQDADPETGQSHKKIEANDARPIIARVAKNGNGAVGKAAVQFIPWRFEVADLRAHHTPAAE